MKNKKILAIVVLIIICLVGVGVYIWLTKNSTSSTNQSSPTINYSEATEQEKQDAEDSKDRIVDDNKSTDPSQSTPNTEGTVVITRSAYENSQLQVSAYISDVVHEGGTCTLTVTKGDTKVTKTTEAVANASSTNCPLFTVERGELPTAGTYKVTVDYAFEGKQANQASSEVVVR